MDLNRSADIVDLNRSTKIRLIKTGETQMTSIVEALVPGGKANPGPPLGPALGPLGVNIKEVVEKINEKTRDYNGMQVPVKVIVDDKKNVEIEVGTPPTASLIMKELGIQKGSGNAGSEVVGNLNISQVAKIARMKKEDVLSYDLKSTMKEVMGTCVPMGVTVEGVKPKDSQKALDQGKFDDLLAGEEW